MVGVNYIDETSLGSHISTLPSRYRVLLCDVPNIDYKERYIIMKNVLAYLPSGCASVFSAIEGPFESALVHEMKEMKRNFLAEHECVSGI
ncbi:hypothetical protein EVAR_55133_1 [Eumeta japonica]|uniref:Uncharacterized protein n=1 Tax=Eumeta variegata TaxID=151549 RepID=A0A4C1YDD3_EUMVA|nr:hypothetical protein EVAR_55133_1 [Eumeta japonica]